MTRRCQGGRGAPIVSIEMAAQIGSFVASNLSPITPKWAKYFPFVRNDARVGFALQLRVWL